jgi:hypothetical protein
MEEPMAAKTIHAPEIISLAEACRRLGISINTATKLPPDQFLPWFWLGDKRFVGRRRFESWLAEKTGQTR